MRSNSEATFAVLIPILGQPGEEVVLLTLRNSSLPAYAGQVSFPGGARDPADRHLRETALREAREEVGLPPENVTIIAELEPFETGRGDCVKPFVGRVRPFRVILNEDEVDRVLYLPVSILRQDPFRSREYVHPETGTMHRVHTFTFEGSEIWGLTARILRRFFVESDPGDAR